MVEKQRCLNVRTKEERCIDQVPYLLLDRNMYVLLIRLYCTEKIENRGKFALPSSLKVLRLQNKKQHITGTKL